MIVTVCESVPEGSPVKVKRAKVCPSAITTVVVDVPSVIVNVPDSAAVRLMLPVRLYWLVVGLQAPGVTSKAMALADKGACRFGEGLQAASQL